MTLISPARFRFNWLRAFAIALAFATPLRAQDFTIAYSTTDPGVTRSITNWGLDTGWPNYDNMYRGLLYMGSNTVNLVQVTFEMFDKVTNDITPQMKLDLTNMVSLASMTRTNAKWILSSGTGGGVTNFFQSGTGTVYPDRWAVMMSAWQRNYATNFPGRTMWLTQPFNEPDWGWGQGSQQNLYDIIGLLQTSNNFSGVNFGGGCTLDCGAATSWYDFINTRVSVGSTHCLNGTANSFVSFIQDVLSKGDFAYASEVHNLGEVIIGANYGLQGGTWWGTAELARASFANACQGKRLGYAENLNNFTASAVYRATNGAVQLFLGGDERHGVATSYRFFSKDRDVFYNGDGPRRDYTTTNPGYAEQVLNVTWGADVQPVINGRYVVICRNSSKVMEVAGSSTSDGANIQQNAYTNGLNQQWDIVPTTANGDFSYYNFTAAHSGKAADLNNFSYADGANVQQWTNFPGVNQQWFFECVSNGWFFIRNRWSGKFLDVNGGSTANGANIFQWTGNGQLNQQWRLVAVGALTPTNITTLATLTGVTATANPLSVKLNWNASAASDLAGYTVLRSTTNGGPYEIAARGLTTNTFTDKFANQNKTYFYVVKAADKSLNVSANSAQVSATPTVVPALVAKYTFDGNTNDSSGNANHPIITYGSPTFVAGKYSSAMDLDGTNQYTMLPANLLASVTNFTFACWVNWDGGSAWQRIFDFGNDTTQYMFLSPSSGSGTLRFAVTTNGGGAEQILQTASALPVGQWVHVAITRSNSIAKLYTNGVVAASSSIFTNTPASFNPALNYLGKSQYADPLFNGRLDDLFIYNYALSDSEIVVLANHVLPSIPTGLTATAGDSQVGLSWNAAAGATSYNVKRSTTNSGPYITITNIAATTFTNIGLVNGTMYYYVVSGTNIYSEGTNSIQVSVRPVSTAQTNIVMSASAGVLNFSWPADHTGWRLQVQTNDLSVGLNTNWFDVNGSSATNNVSLPMNMNNSSVFYRLVYP